MGCCCSRCLPDSSSDAEDKENTEMETFSDEGLNKVIGLFKEILQELERCKKESITIYQHRARVQEHIQRLHLEAERDAVTGSQAEVQLTTKPREEIKSELDNVNTELDNLTKSPRKYPECAVCLESCDPVKHRAAFCCPEGHIVCQSCEWKLKQCPQCRLDRSQFGGRFTRLRLEDGEDDIQISKGNLRDFSLRASVLLKRKDDLEAQMSSFEAKSSAILQSQPDSLLESDLSDARREVLKMDSILKSTKLELEHFLTKMRLLPNDALLSIKAKAVAPAPQKTIQNASVATGPDKSLSARQADRPTSVKTATPAINIFNIQEQVATNWSKQPQQVAKDSCHCSLKCPHGRDACENCVIKRNRACLCVTNVVAFRISIGGIMRGNIIIHLLGRTHPRAVRRFFKMATNRGNDSLLGTAINLVERNSWIAGGKYTSDAEVFDPGFSKMDKLRDITPKDVVPARKYFLAVGDTYDHQLTSFKILLNPKPIPTYRVIGKVVRGTEVVDAIHQLPLTVDKDGHHRPLSAVDIVNSHGDKISRKEVLSL